MTDLFEDEEILEGDEFEDVELDAEVDPGLDARRRLEKMLEERRLQDELDDFVDY